MDAKIKDIVNDYIDYIRENRNYNIAVFHCDYQYHLVDDAFDDQRLTDITFDNEYMLGYYCYRKLLVNKYYDENTGRISREEAIDALCSYEKPAGKEKMYVTPDMINDASDIDALCSCEKPAEKEKMYVTPDMINDASDIDALINMANSLGKEIEFVEKSSYKV